MAYTEHLSLGHSYSAAGTASGASDDAHTFVQLINAAIGSPTLTRHGRSQATVTASGIVPNGASASPTSGYAGQDSVIDPFRNTIAGSAIPTTGTPGASRFGAATGLITIANGLNDLRSATAVPVPALVKRYKSMIAKLLEASFYDDSDASWTAHNFSNNNWTAQNQGATVKGSVTSGHKDTWACPAGFPAGAILVAHTGAFDSTGATRLGGIWRIRDATAATDLISAVDMKAEANATGGGSFTQGVILLANPSIAGHSVELIADTIVSAAYIDGMGWIIPSTAPTVLVYGQPQITATGATNGTMAAGYNTRITAMNSALSTMCTEFQAVGLNVKYVDMSAMDSNTSYFASDQFHPNDTGHALMATNGLALLVQSLTRSATDTVSASDAVTRIAAHPRATPDAVSASDAATRAALARTRTSADTVSATDAGTGALGLPRAGTDAVSASDAATRTAASPRAPTDTVTIADSATRAALARTRTSADTVTVADAPTTSAIGHPRSVADAVAIADSATRTAQGYTRAVADAVTIADAATRAALSWVRSAADTLGLADAPTRLLGAVRALSDAVGITDQAATGGGLTRTTADSLSIADAATRAALALTRTGTDTAALADAAMRSQAQVRTGTDTVTIADLATGVAGAVSFTRSAADSLGLSDAVTRAASAARATADTVSVANATTRAPQALTRALGDNLTAGDGATVTYATSRSTADTVTLADQAASATDVIDRTPVGVVGGDGSLRDAAEGASSIRAAH